MSGKKRTKEVLQHTQKEWGKMVYGPEDMLCVPKVDANGQKVKWRGPKGDYKNEKVVLVPSSVKVRESLQQKMISPGCEWSKEDKSWYCKLCDVFIGGAKKSAFDEHFGFGNFSVNQKHLEKLMAELKKIEEGENTANVAAPRQVTLGGIALRNQAAKELKNAFFSDLIGSACEANITAGQLHVFRPFLLKWCKSGTGFLEDADLEWQFRKVRPAIYKARKADLEARAKANRQLTLAVDAGTDARHVKAMYFTLDFDQQSFLWQTIFDGQMTAEKLVALVNETVISSFGSLDVLDIVTGDRIAYHMSAFDIMGKMAPHTLFLPDVCHGADGLINALLSGFPLLQQVVQDLKRTFRSNYTGVANAWELFQLERDLYPLKMPSPGNTRAWAGPLKILHFVLQRFEALCDFFKEVSIVDQLSASLEGKALGEIEHLEGAQRIQRTFASESQRILFETLTFERLAEKMQLQILRGESRVAPSMHTVFRFYKEMRDQFLPWNEAKLNRTGGEFEKLLQGLDPLLLQMYKSLESGKNEAKRSIFTGVLNVKTLLVKNWGDVELKSDGTKIDLVFHSVGDCWKEPAMCFYLLAAYMDPVQAKEFGMPLSESVVRRGMPWKLPNDLSVHQLGKELADYVDQAKQALLPNNLDLVEMWKGFDAGANMYNMSPQELLVHVGKRIVEKPSGAAQVERAVSVVTEVLSKKRLRMADATVAQTAFIRSSSKVREHVALKREAKKRKRKELLRFELHLNSHGKVVPNVASQVTQRQRKKLEVLRQALRGKEPRPTKKQRLKRQKKEKSQ